MNSNVEGMRRATPRAFVPSKRIKKEHERYGKDASLKVFARSIAARAEPGEDHADAWLNNKASPPASPHRPSSQGRAGWTHDGRSRLGLGAPLTSPSGHVAQGCIFGA